MAEIPRLMADLTNKQDRLTMYSLLLRTCVFKMLIVYL